MVVVMVVAVMVLVMVLVMVMSIRSGTFPSTAHGSVM